SIYLPLLLFSLLPPPPKSTLFPYTTLFRSLDEIGHLEHTEDVRLRGHHGRRLGEIDRAELELLQELLVAAELARAIHDDLVLAADRKSTRLNSSHDQISYAVFCLKKKTR